MISKCHWLYFALFLFFNLSLFSQVTVNGRIIDNTYNEPLVGARIFLDSTETLTNAEGYFQFNLKPGTYEATIRFMGFEDKTVTLNTAQPNAGVIILEISKTTLGEVLISSSPNAFSTTFKGSNYRISPSTLTNSNPLNTEEVLRTIPGVNIVGDMGLSNRPNISIRGSWGRRSKKVLMMEDGSPSAPAPYVAPGTYYNPVSDRITAIEVYKGADMLRFGPNNMYGAVNYITALPPQKPELRLKLVGGQRNYTTALLSYGGTWKNLGALVEGVYKSFDGFTNNSSVQILNLNAKIFAKLTENQSLYFKVSGQFENNQASLSALTPYTFSIDPTQNPFDADQFTMRRYGVDIIHKWLPVKNLSFTSKIYASDFERDWWKQTTAKIKAADAHDYLGDDIFNQRYSYLSGQTFTDEDYLIVGRVLDGRESATDSRWAFTVFGVKENIVWDWKAFGKDQHLEIGLNYHQETYKDITLLTDSSRWARNGQTIGDLRYFLWSVNGFVRNEFQVGKFGLTPIVRFEHVDMYRQNLLDLAQDPTLENIKQGREYNRYSIALPGLTVDYELGKGELYASVYEGMIAPSKVFGFLVEQNGIITNPFANQSINIQPELSWNTELGWRGDLLKGKLSAQLTYFNNHARNFYAGGRNEVFELLGKINMQGIEAAVAANLIKRKNYKLSGFANLTLLQSTILSGKLSDNDLFSQVVHNDATRNEYLEKVNANRGAYEIYTDNEAGEKVLLTNETITAADFSQITKSVVKFGDGGIQNAEAPYAPRVNLSAGLNYDWKNLALGFSGNYVGSQFTEFNNFMNESADGAIGKLAAYYTVDAFLNYDFSIGKKCNFNAFVNGKNITNTVYKASRLNRATSGLFPGGFRQVIFGVTFHL